MTNATFTPLADDKFAAATPLGLEVATIKPSGYIHHRGFIPPAMLPEAVQSLRDYFESQGRGEPVIYTRTVGETEWVATEVPEVTIPDELPEDFKG